jgi:hypothetical protein
MPAELYLRSKVKDVVGIIEARLKDSVVLEVVPRAECQLFRNQILLDAGDGEYLVSVIKTRQSRRT